MSTENITRGYIVRYMVPFHLQHSFKRHIATLGIASNADHSLIGSLFVVSGNQQEHQKLEKFLKDCRNEMRTLYISNRNVDKVLQEAEMWGLKVYTGKRGILFTRATVTADTLVLDRFENCLNASAIF
jgi:hypothetical protein